MSETTHVIWSFKHRQWWGPSLAGYTPHLDRAGRYTPEQAGEIVTSSVMGESVCIYTPVAERYGQPTVTGLGMEVAS